MQIVQNKCLRVCYDFSRGTPISQMHNKIEYVNNIITKITSNFFQNCSNSRNPLIKEIGQYNIGYLESVYKKYKHKRTKHILL